MEFYCLLKISSNLTATKIDNGFVTVKVLKFVSLYKVLWCGSHCTIIFLSQHPHTHKLDCFVLKMGCSLNELLFSLLSHHYLTFSKYSRIEFIASTNSFSSRYHFSFIKLINLFYTNFLSFIFDYEAVKFNFTNQVCMNHIKEKVFKFLNKFCVRK